MGIKTVFYLPFGIGFFIYGIKVLWVILFAYEHAVAFGRVVDEITRSLPQNISFKCLGSIFEVD